MFVIDMTTIQSLIQQPNKSVFSLVVIKLDVLPLFKKVFYIFLTYIGATEFC